MTQVAYVAMTMIHIGEHVVSPPPARYPDLFAVLNVLVSCAVFGLGWLWGMATQVEAGWALLIPVSGDSRPAEETKDAAF